MLLSDDPVAAPPTTTRPGALLRLLRVLVALLASVLALVCGAVLLGAHLPAIPVVGPIGSGLAGDLPVHVALLAVARSCWPWWRCGPGWCGGDAC